MTVNHGVLGSSPCSGAIARGLQARCRKADVDSAFRLIAEVLQSQAIFGIGSLAQLVQSICLTSRGSAVRIRQLPQRITIRLTTDFHQSFFLFLGLCGLCANTLACPKNKTREANARVSNRVRALTHYSPVERGCGDRGVIARRWLCKRYPREFGLTPSLRIRQLPQRRETLCRADDF